MNALTIDLADHHRNVLGMTLPQMLTHAATRWGDQLALDFFEYDGTRLTWSEFRDAVSHVRSGLEAAGVEPGDKIGVLLRNQVEFPLTWLAAAETGATIVPVNPKYTLREAEFVLEDTEATWLVVDRDILDALDINDRLGPVRTERMFIVSDDPEDPRSFHRLRSAELAPARHSSDVDDLANIQFTSGTTGLPKGCMLTHRYWVEFGVYAAALFSDPQNILADHPFYYIQNQAYLAMAMAGGGALHVTNGMSRRKFMGWLVDRQIDFAWIDEMMLDEPASPDDAKLRLKRAAIAAIPKSAHAELERRFDLQARDWYASTEVGVGTFVPWDRTDLVGSGSMGYAFPTRETMIVDENLEPVPPGHTGELCVRGSGMMLGYYNRPEANAELFLPGAWFRTGDLVRKESDGLHYYEGRTRDTVRRSGENIAAAEVELQIASMPEVDEVGVVPVPSPERGEEVKAIIVLKPGATATATEIVEWAKQGLAAFKVPRYVEFRDELPHTPSGKIAKSVLRSEDPFGPGVVDASLLAALPTQTTSSEVHQPTSL